MMMILTLLRFLEFAFNLLNKFLHRVIKLVILRDPDVHCGLYKYAQPAVWFVTRFNNQRDDGPFKFVCIRRFCLQTEKEHLTNCC